MDEQTKQEIKQMIEEAHRCPLSNDDIGSLKLVCSFITRFRNALGNFMMLIIFVLIVAAVGGILWLVTAGHINIFKSLGIGV